MVGSNFNWKVKVEAATQSMSHSDSVLSVGLSIEANNQIRLAEIGLVLIEIVDQIFDFALLAAFNRDRAPRVREAKHLTRLNTQHGREESVAVVWWAAAVQAAIFFDDRFTRVC